jgi:hypothetical protein
MKRRFGNAAPDEKDVQTHSPRLRRLRKNFAGISAALALGLVSAPASAEWENWLQVERFQLGPTGKVTIYTRQDHQCGGRRLDLDPTVSLEAHRMLFDMLLAYHTSFSSTYFHALIVSCDGTGARLTHVEVASGGPPP